VTKFTRVELPQAEVASTTSNLMPYTNHIILSVKVMNGFKTVTFPIAHWQPKGKPMFFATCIIYDADVSLVALKLQRGESILVEGKFGYDVYNGISKHFILADSIKRVASNETVN